LPTWAENKEHGLDINCLPTKTKNKNVNVSSRRFNILHTMVYRIKVSVYVLSLLSLVFPLNKLTVSDVPDSFIILQFYALAFQLLNSLPHFFRGLGKEIITYSLFYATIIAHPS